MCMCTLRIFVYKILSIRGVQEYRICARELKKNYTLLVIFVSTFKRLNKMNVNSEGIHYFSEYCHVCFVLFKISKILLHIIFNNLVCINDGSSFKSIEKKEM